MRTLRLGELGHWAGKPLPVAQIEPAFCFVNNVFLEPNHTHSLIRSCVIYGYFQATVAELSGGNQGLIYLLPGTLEKRFADPWCRRFALVTGSVWLCIGKTLLCLTPNPLSSMLLLCLFAMSIHRGQTSSGGPSVYLIQKGTQPPTYKSVRLPTAKYRVYLLGRQRDKVGT